MLDILRKFIEGDFQVTEYTRDGKTVSHTVKVPVQSEIPEGETIPVQPTFDQRIKGLEDENAELLIQNALQDVSITGLQDENAELMFKIANLEASTNV